MPSSAPPAPAGFGEDLYQLFWQMGVRRGACFSTSDRRKVEVLSPGILNSDAGPDFSFARIRIDGRLWVGNVEIHVRASDWHRHGHDSDPAYESVVLHVVALDDTPVRHPSGSLIPQIQISLPPDFLLRAQQLRSRPGYVKCDSRLASISPFLVRDWLESLSVMRLRAKAARIASMLDSLSGDWSRTAFISLSRALGFGKNGDPFEMMARSIPFNKVQSHSDSPLQLEALFFGQAGMLRSDSLIFDDYYQSLCSEYIFLAHKYALRPIDPSLWKNARTRPANFPHRRIALLAAYCLAGFSLHSRMIDLAADPAAIRPLFLRPLSPFWQSHFSFFSESQAIPTLLSPASVDLLMINFTAPFLYAYGVEEGRTPLIEASLAILHATRPESNSVIRIWRNAFCGSGTAVPADAAQSQALLHLYNEYCLRERCTRCRWGWQVFFNHKDR